MIPATGAWPTWSFFRTDCSTNFAVATWIMGGNVSQHENNGDFETKCRDENFFLVYFWPMGVIQRKKPSWKVKNHKNPFYDSFTVIYDFPAKIKY